MHFTPAKTIASNQHDLHTNLELVVSKHLAHRFTSPIARHNQAAFIQAHEYWHIQNQPKVILDSGCGTADSTRYLAHHYPDHLVIGIDQSEKRVNNSSNQALPANCLTLRCECSDFWRLAEKEHWQFNHHYLLYPNPWPKSQHLNRRWHGHPAFSSLLHISKKLELRTNWHIYAEEFVTALQIAKVYESKCIHHQPKQAISAFEKKYMLSKHKLWRVTSTL